MTRAVVACRRRLGIARVLLTTPTTRQVLLRVAHHSRGRRCTLSWSSVSTAAIWRTIAAVTRLAVVAHVLLILAGLGRLRTTATTIWTGAIITSVIIIIIIIIMNRFVYFAGRRLHGGAWSCCCCCLGHLSRWKDGDGCRWWWKE